MKRYLQRVNLLTVMRFGVLYGYYSIYDLIITQQKRMQGK